MLNSTRHRKAVSPSCFKCGGIDRHAQTPANDVHNLFVIRPEELDGAPFLLYPSQRNMRTAIDRFLDGLELNRRVVMEASDTEAIKRLVESGFGYSILPEYALKESTKFFQTLRIKGHRLVRSQALAMPTLSQPRALTESIAEFIRVALAD